MTGQTITEKILARAAGEERVVPGQTVTAKIDVLMMHDVTSTGAIKILNENFDGKIADGLEVVVVPDHYVPPKDIDSAKLYQELRGFVDHQKAQGANIRDHMLEGGDYGVCHVMLPEKGHVLPGQVLVGGDSHTCTYGALGAFSTGIGTTEAGNVLATGKLWFQVPESMAIVVGGRMPGNTMAKDLFLKVVGDIGVDGALYKAMEWAGSTISNMPMDERLTLTNMAIEAGAKSGIIAPDQKTLGYILHRRGVEKGPGIERYRELCGLKSDIDARYSDSLRINASGLVPLVACPDLPSNVKPASELGDIKIDQAYIGGCTGGKWTDFLAAANVLKGKRIANGVRLLVVPSTADIQRKMVKKGLYNIFMDAGAIVSAPTCGACLGGYMGILAPGERAITSTNRNFRGRMGDPESEVYLASPKTVAASALAGYIAGVENA
jgi:3-isopropylmalate/(R)-2-methylmalate dehydratase large subunit